MGHRYIQKISCLLPVFCLGGISSVYAQNQPLKIGPAAKWAKPSKLIDLPDEPGGLLFFRRNDLQIHLDDKGESTFSSQRMKLLDARALEAGNLNLTWNPASGEPTVHTVKIHRDGETIDVLEANSFQVIQREDQLEQSMLNGFLTAVLSVPDLRVDDELELSFTVPSHDPTFASTSSGLMSLGAAPMAGQHMIGLSWDKGQKPGIRLTDDLNEFVHRNKNSIKVKVENPDILTPPKDAPPRFQIQRVLEYSDHTSWPTLSKEFSILYDAASQLPENSKLKNEAARIARAHATELDRAKAALKLVQRQIRYIYVGMDGGNYRPATADETWERRYGDCKGKTVALLALFSELGIEAEAVLVSNSGFDDAFFDRLPSPSLFDHVLVRAKIDGETYWLDGTLPDIIAPSQRPFIAYNWVLPLTASGETLESVPQDPYDLPQEMGLVEIDARAGFSEPAKRIQTSVERGVDGLAEYYQYSTYTAPQLKAMYKEALTGSTSWDTVEDVTYHYDRDTQASILKIIGTGPIDWDENGSGKYSLSLPGGGFIPPSRRQRAESESDIIPFYSNYSYSCHATTVRLPEDTKLQNWGFNSTYLTSLYGRTYYRMMERRDDHTVRMVRSARVEEREISPGHAKLDGKRLDGFDNSKAVITHHLTKAREPRGTFYPVPATYEIDWTSDNPPCLPKKEKAAD